MIKINLGDKVKHEISGVEGIAVASTEYISGCRRITIQQKVKKDGMLPDSLSFDEPELEVVKAKVIKEKGKETGGWKPNMSRDSRKSNLYSK